MPIPRALSSEMMRNSPFASWSVSAEVGSSKNQNLRVMGKDLGDLNDLPLAHGELVQSGACRELPHLNGRGFGRSENATAPS